MKNVFKLFGLMLLAGSMTLVCSCGDDDDTNTNGNNEGTTFTVTATPNDATMGQVSITPKKDAYNAGDTVTIAAIAHDGYEFVRWSGDVNSVEPVYTFVVEKNVKCTAKFEAIGGQGETSWNATFDGSALDVNGYGDFFTNGSMWLLQVAKSGEDNQLQLPSIIMWLAGSSASDLAIDEESSAPVELYKDHVYTSGSEQYGDWQFYSTSSFNCTAMDPTALTMSFTGSFTMWSLTDIVEEVAEDEDEATKATLNFTGNNLVFEVPSRKGMHKMTVVK